MESSRSIATASAKKPVMSVKDMVNMLERSDKEVAMLKANLESREKEVARLVSENAVLRTAVVRALGVGPETSRLEAQIGSLEEEKAKLEADLRNQHAACDAQLSELKRQMRCHREDFERQKEETRNRLDHSLENSWNQGHVAGWNAYASNCNSFNQFTFPNFPHPEFFDSNWHPAVAVAPAPAVAPAVAPFVAEVVAEVVAPAAEVVAVAPAVVQRAIDPNSPKKPKGVSTSMEDKALYGYVSTAEGDISMSLEELIARANEIKAFCLASSCAANGRCRLCIKLDADLTTFVDCISRGILPPCAKDSSVLTGKDGRFSVRMISEDVLSKVQVLLEKTPDAIQAARVRTNPTESGTYHAVMNFMRDFNSTFWGQEQSHGENFHGSCAACHILGVYNPGHSLPTCPFLNIIIENILAGKSSCCWCGAAHPSDSCLAKGCTSEEHGPEACPHPACSCPLSSEGDTYVSGSPFSIPATTVSSAPAPTATDIPLHRGFGGGRGRGRGGRGRGRVVAAEDPAGSAGFRE